MAEILREKRDISGIIAAHRSELMHRDAAANKGSYGRLLIMAGSRGMAGAAYLSGLAAFRSGIGMVKYLAPEANRIILQTMLPEAMYESWEQKAYTDRAGDFCASGKASVCGNGGGTNDGVYESDVYDGSAHGSYIDKEKLDAGLDWADYVIIGPGLSKSEEARETVRLLFDEDITERLHKKKLVIIDADALNIIADEGLDLKRLAAPDCQNIVITPHIMEMLRLIRNATAVDKVCCGSPSYDESRESDSSGIRPNELVSLHRESSCGTASDSCRYIKLLKEFTDTESIKQAPEEAAAAFAALKGINVILKDNETAIAELVSTAAAKPYDGLENAGTAADVSIRTMLLSPGCGAMAKAGSGDTLCGFIAGTAAVLKENITDALPVSVYLHGRAGCLAAEEKGEHSILAGDIAEHAGAAIKSLFT